MRATATIDPRGKGDVTISLTDAVRAPETELTGKEEAVLGPATRPRETPAPLRDAVPEMITRSVEHTLLKKTIRRDI